MPNFTLSILHISDLHARSPEGLRPERRAQIQREARQRERVLGPEWEDNLNELFSDRSPDLVCLTGDVADWGLPTEYRAATQRLLQLRAYLGIGPDRVFVVPGNHDIRRTIHTEAWRKVRALIATEPEQVSEWLAGGDPPRAVEPDLVACVLERGVAFWEWVESSLGRPELRPGRGEQSMHPNLGYRANGPSLGYPFPVHIIGLDSAWLAGDEHDAQKLWLTRHQINLLAATEDGDSLEGFRLVLVHHPLDDLGDALDARRQLAELADLVLHGHQHVPAATTWADPDHRLRNLAAGCLYEGSAGDRWPNTCQRIDIRLDERGRPLSAEIRFRSWSPNGFWHDASGLYRNAPAGVLNWSPWAHAPTTPRITSAPSTTAPPSILVLAAEPSDRDRIRTAARTSTIRAALERGHSGGPLSDFRDVGSTRASRIATHMDRSRPNILHVMAPGRDDGALGFEDEAHRTHWVTPAEWISMSSNRQVDVLVLCTSHSSRASHDFLAVARCVVSVEGWLRPKVAMMFSRAFYEALRRGDSVAAAFTHGCNALRPGFEGPVFRLNCRKATAPSGLRFWSAASQ